MSIKWTAEQKAVIESREKNLLVSAAAGSGKTAVLIERIKQLIIKEKTPIDSMLIVTYTNAAAAEMRQKIVDSINNELKDSPSPFLIEQLENINKAQISTFHSFAKEVLQRYFYLIDIDPMIKVSDESQLQFFKSESLDELFKDYFDENDEAFIKLLNAYATSKSEDRVRKMILDVYTFIQSIPERYDWLNSSVEKLSTNLCEFKNSDIYEEIKLDIIKNLRIATKYFEDTRDVFASHGVMSRADKVDMDIKKIESAIQYISEGMDISKAFETITFERMSSLKAEKEALELIKESTNALRDAGKKKIRDIKDIYSAKSIEAYLQDINDTYEYALTLKKAVLDFARIFSEKKRELALVDFNDLEHMAIELLNKEEVATYYRDKFEYIFIDEYQDSNRIQEYIIDKIKRKDNLFMVGDIKQSIYKFRLADPEIFIDKYNKFETESTSNDLINLSKNFRSKSPIIDEVNNIFKKLIKKDINGIDYEALELGVQCSSDFEIPVDMYLLDTSVDDLNNQGLGQKTADMKKIEAEAALVAQIVNENIGKPIFDAKEACVRNLKKRDIVVLLRSMKNKASYYYNALLDAGVPAFLESGSGYFETTEIEVFMNFLKVIDNGKQDIPLVSTLHSPIFSFTIDDLIKIRLSGKELSFYQAFEKYPEIAAEQNMDNTLVEKVKKSQLILEKARADASFMALDDLLWELMRGTGYYIYVGALPSGQQRQANLRALVDKAGVFQKDNLVSLQAFIRYIDKIKENDIPIGQVSLLGENDDLVRIMSIHKSKGLEYPMVIVGGLANRFNMGRGDTSINFHKDVGIALKWVNPEIKAYHKTLIQSLISSKAKQEDMAEEMRVLYVALTRAMDKLVLVATDAKKSVSFPQDANSYAEALLPLLADSGVEVHNVGMDHLEVADDEPILDFSTFEEDMNAQSNFADSELTKKLSYEYPYNTEVKPKYGAGEFVSQKELKRNAFSFEKTSSLAADRGIEIHKVFEYLDFRNPQIDQDEKYRKEVQAFIESQVFLKIQEAESIFKETPFVLRKIREGEDVIVQGVIDLYAEKEDGLILLDYKTGYPSDPLTLYKPQIEIYKEALEKIENKPVKEAYLYMVDQRKEIRVF